MHFLHGCPLYPISMHILHECPLTYFKFFSIFLILSQDLPWRKRSLRGTPQVADCLKYIPVQPELL